MNFLFILFVLYIGGLIIENVDMSLYVFLLFYVRYCYKFVVLVVVFILGMWNKVDRFLNVLFMFNLLLG